jgi:uncharacterized membrane protein YfcA
MARSTRKKPIKQNRKVKAGSVMALCMTAGFFLGFGLGALMDRLLLVMLFGLVAGAAAGYYFDKKNGVSYTQRKSRSDG